MKNTIFKKQHTFVFIFFLLIFMLHQPLSAEVVSDDTLKVVTHTNNLEYFEGEYIPIERDSLDKSPAYEDNGSGYFTTQVNISESGENIVGDAANEPSIAIDPTDPDKMVIGWRQFNTIENSFRQAGYGYTLDGGDTWTFPGVIDEGVFRSDPVLDADADGNIFYNSLTVSGNLYYCDVYKMEPGDTEWDDGTYALGGDKQWMVVDRTEGEGSGNIYAGWTSSFSICYPDCFTRSVDGGEVYEDCVDMPGHPRWGTLAVGPDGTLYAAGYSDNGFIFMTSPSAQFPQWPVSWDPYEVVDFSGDASIRVGPNPDGLLGQTWIAIDQSDGPYSGYIYILCSVERFNGDPDDVMFLRSTDGGDTWDDPVRVNQDLSNNNWQWFGTMSVSPDGRIDVIWLDTRDGEMGTYGSSLYYSYSIDGGESFSDNERISEAFNPHVGWPQQQKMGDYFHMVSDYDYAHLAWANTVNGEQDVYYTRINPWFVGIESNAGVETLPLTVFPNPAKELINVKYQVEKRGNIEIVLTDMYGKEVFSKINQSPVVGINTEQIQTGNLSHGIYILNVTTNNKRSSSKVFLLK